MSENKRQKLDRKLIKLLGKRIALLAKSDDRTTGLAISELEALLAEKGVPDFVWQDVVTVCLAAQVANASAATQTSCQRVTIVGGRGVMGQFFSQRLSVAGHTVKTLGRNDWDNAAEILGETDLALICVPIDRTLEVIRQTAQYLPETAILADITSIKTPMLEAMLDAHPGPVVGLHPMFGPGVNSFLSQKVVVCHGRQAETYAWLLAFMKEDGGDLVECSPEEHDRITIAVQTLRHFSTFSLGVFLAEFLAEEGVTVGRSLELSSPIYRLGINMVGRLFAQDAALYADIMLSTEDRRRAIARLADTFSKLAHLVQEQDRSQLIDRFAATTQAFGAQETDRALRESDRLINALCVMLAAERQQAIDTSTSLPGC